MTQERNCGNCAHADRPAYEYPCTACESLYDCPPTKWEAEDKPQTNAEHIRGMADEELAWEFMEFRFDGYAVSQGSEPALPNTQVKILEWLQQPYKENEDE